jgi:ankyrin repeat protein
MLAVKRGRTETVKKLIEAGADSGIQGFDRKNALDIAREHKRSDLLPLLRP